MEVTPAAVGRGTQRPTPLAWIALPLAFVWIVPLGLFVGILDTILGAVSSVAAATLAVVVLLRSRHGVDHGRVLAWIALTGVAAHVVVTLALGLILGLVAERLAPEILEDPGWAMPPVDPAPGDCLVSATQPAPAPCDEPHRAEVVGTYTLPDRGWFDDPEADADQLCNRVVAEFLDISEYEASTRYGLSISGEEPYEVSCWAVSDDPVTGTMRVTRP